MDKGTAIRMPDVTLKPVQPIENNPEPKFIIPLDGKWAPAENSIHIGKNFSTLTNMRYRDNHPETILGMAKINTAVMSATYIKPRAGIHFAKSNPAETHVLMQAYNAGETASAVLENTTAIPSAGAFESTPLWVDSAGAGIGQFSEAPDGQITYCNGVDTCLWGGTEIECESFIVSSAAVTMTGVVTNPRNYTEIMKNFQSDAANSAVIGGGNDSYTVALLHGDGADGSTTITGSEVGGSAAPKTWVADNDAQIDTAVAKFGTGSILFDGTDDFVHCDSTDADIDDFYMGTGAFTIDFWVRFASVAAGKQGLFSQYVDADNYVECYFEQISTASFIRLKIRSGGVDKVSLFTITGPCYRANTWYHVALIRGWDGDADEWAVTLNGAKANVTQTDADAWPDLNADFDIGRCQAGGATYLNGSIDEFRVSKGIARWTASFTPWAKPYGGTVSRTWLIGSLRPLQAVKLYIAEPNHEASVLTGSVHTASSWQSLTLTDGTDVGGVSLAQTGVVFFDSTVGIATPTYIEGKYLYWYQFTLSAGEASIYCTTLDAPFQNIVDIWDGLYRQIASAYLYTTARVDYTSQLRNEDFTVSDIGVYNTYIAINALAALSDPNNCLEVGFTEKQTALFIGMAGVYVNDQDTNIRIDYWNGEEYISVGAVSDGTKIGDHSLAQSGVVSWTNNALADETPKTIANKSPLYTYRISWDAQLGAAVALDLICGIPAPVEIKGYSFGIHAAGRLMLGGYTYGRGNSLRISSSNAPQVFNGDDAYEIPFGGDEALTCGVAIFAQYTSNLFNLALVFKKTETWILNWTVVDDETIWERFPIASDIGCPAPRTLKAVSMELDKNISQVKTVGIWRGNAGIYISNGQTPMCVSDDIENVFDQTKTPHVNLAMVEKEVGFFDRNKGEYHWLWASGSSTTLDKEYAFDVKRRKWFEIDRTTGKRLQLGLEVTDTYGNPYTYGTIDTGYMLRLEYGTDFDGVDITSTMKFGYQIPIQADLLAETSILRTALTTVAKNTDSVLTMTHTEDGAAAGVDYTLSMADATHTFTTIMQDLGSVPGIFHTFEFVAASDDETKGFEPLFFSMYYEKIRDHKH